MKHRLRITARHLATVITLVLVIAWVWRLDAGRIDQDATTVAIALVRSLALVFAAYLLVLAVVGALGHLLALPRATRTVDRLTLPFLRALLGGTATLGVMTAPPAAPTPLPPPPVTTVAPVPAAPDARATLHLLSADAHEVEPSPVTTDDTWTVQPGESLWLIATSHLTESRGAVSEQAIDTYWRHLIDANRDRLANPDDPNLLFADQELVLPPVDAG